MREPRNATPDGPEIIAIILLIKKPVDIFTRVKNPEKIEVLISFKN
jgi:hypothetical protein